MPHKHAHHDHAKKTHGDGKEHSGKHEEAGDAGQLSQAITNRDPAEVWSDPKALKYFLDCFSYIWNNKSAGAELPGKQHDPTMRAALANFINVRDWAKDPSGGLVTLAIDTWSSSVKDTINYAIAMAGRLPDANVENFQRGKDAYRDVVGYLAETNMRSDQKEAEEAGAGAGIKAPNRGSKKQLADTVKALADANELAETAVDAIVGLSGDEKFSAGAAKIKQLYEIFTGPDELAENFKNSKGALQKMESIDEMLQYAATVLETFTVSVFSIGSRLATGETAKFLGEISESFETWIGRGAAVLQIVASALECVDKISEGDYEGAAKAAVGVGEGVIMLFAPETGPVFATAAMWWYEVSELTAATAGFLDMIGDKRKRHAVEKVLSPAQYIAPFAKGLAVDLEAWGKRVGDKSHDPEVLALEAKQLQLRIDGDATVIASRLESIHKELANHATSSVGGYDDLMAAYEVGTYNAAPESKVNPSALSVSGWNPPGVVYERARFTALPGFVRALLHGIQSLASVGGGDAVEARTARLTELTRIGPERDLTEGEVVQIAMPWNADGGSSVLTVESVELQSTDDAFQMTNQSYARQLKSSAFADAADQINHPIELRYRPLGSGTYSATVKVTVSFPDGHSETRSLTVKTAYGAG